MIKWIGQHIWDFVSRFRNDVYLESLTTTTESNVLVVDSDGKVSKSTSVGGDITGVTAGTNCSGGGTTGNVTINVDDAFLINSGDDTTTGTITAGGFTTTGTWTFDEYTSGTVGITTVQDSGTTFNDNDTSLMTAAAIDDRINAAVATTVGSDVDLTSEVSGVLPVTNGGTGATSLDDQQILIGNGTGAIETSTYLTFTSAASLLSLTGIDATASPSFQLLNANTNSGGPQIKFENTPDGEDGDVLGTILFHGHDNGSNNQDFAKIVGEIATAADGQEGGLLRFQVAAHDGGVENGLILQEGNVDGEVDVTLGNGSASTTTIAGTLTMGSTAFVNNSGVVQVATQGTIDHDSLANFSPDEHFTQANIVATGALNSGSITSGFGNIDIGSSTFDTTGAVTTGTLTADQIKHEISGSTTAGDIGHGAEVLYGVGTTSVTAGRIYTLHGGTWEEINAGNEDDSSGLMAVASIAAGNGNSSNGMIIKGCVTLENVYVSTTNEELGAIVYSSTTNGRATTVMPSSSNEFVRILGYSLNVSDKKMFFNPDTTYIQRQ
jgi:hypothetical protein